MKFKSHDPGDQGLSAWISASHGPQKDSRNKKQNNPLVGQSRFDDSEDLFSVLEELSSLR